MKKLFKGLICGVLCGAMALSVSGCSNSASLDPEKDTLKLSVGAVDQKFNPMFYTAQNDGEVIAPTQISLITTEPSGNNVKLACGESQPTLALAYQETYYNENGVAIGSGTGDGSVTGASSTDGSTVYEFVIKKGVKDSTGTELNVMDVLFNLYVYLDPAYTGSSTIYSTKIKGLQAYRQQDPDASEESSEDTSKYYGAALDRVNALISWSEDNTSPTEDQLTEAQKKDLARVKALYLEELTTDWSSIETSWVESYKEYNFTAAWQVFLYLEGLVNRQTRLASNGSTEYVKGDNDKYLTTLDPDWSTGDVSQQALIDDMNAAVQAAGAVSDDEILAAQKNWAINHMYDSNTAPKQIAYVLNNCATGNSALEYFVAEERTNDFESKKVDGQLVVPRISGITVYKSSKLVNQYSQAEQTFTDGEHDILRIEIQGVDPKAKWNFGVTVAPMHYYSTTEYYNKAMSDYNTGKVYAGTATNFGVEFNDINWMNDNLLASGKTSLPVGAGPYKCSTSGKTPATSGVQFFDGSVAYYERNEYFETLGSGIDNAKIKYMQYKVIRDDMIISALQTGEIYYGEPLATATNLAVFANAKNLKTITYQTGGYGYVGINPKYVPDLEVRQAIMMAMDTTSITTYYGSNLVNIINRPVSSTSWASKVQWDGKDWDRYYPLATDDTESTAEEKIRNKVVSSGNWYYDEKAGKLKSTQTGEVLSYTFTIAGESLDHPAYKMFVNAETLLEAAGFEISVEQDIRALKKLATGDLAVWAAAWSSSIDPDPYQIYSKNSNTTSTKNWYKDGIYNDAKGIYSRERAIAEELNKLIDAGRETLDQDERIEIYDQCYDLIMQLAVEFPTYQRNDLCVYDATILDADTMTKNPTYLLGPIDELWKLNYKK